MYSSTPARRSQLSHFTVVNPSDVAPFYEQDKRKQLRPAEETLKDMLARKWTVDMDPTRAISKSQIKRKVCKLQVVRPLGDRTEFSRPSPSLASPSSLADQAAIIQQRGCLNLRVVY
jgi:hypothetical protein